MLPWCFTGKQNGQLQLLTLWEACFEHSPFLERLTINVFKLVADFPRRVHVIRPWRRRVVCIGTEAGSEDGFALWSGRDDELKRIQAAARIHRSARGIGGTGRRFRGRGGEEDPVSGAYGGGDGALCELCEGRSAAA